MSGTDHADRAPAGVPGSVPPVTESDEVPAGARGTTAPATATAAATTTTTTAAAAAGTPTLPSPSPSPSRAGREAQRLEGALRTAWLAGGAVFGVQLVALLAWSWHLWTRFDLTADMATFSQAWQQIATGHLNPYETTFAYNYPHYGYPFYQSHLELLMWPLALLYWVWPHAVDLLVVQDLAVVGAGLAAYRWGLEHVARHWTGPRRGAVAVGIGLLVVLVVTPWTYWTATFDFHFQPIAVCFTLLAGRDLWAGRRRGWIWVAVVLVCGDVAATYLLGLGVAAAVGGRSRWRTGVALLVVGVVWLGVVGLVHSGKGSSLSVSYGYLAHGPVADGLGGVVAILTGLVTHPSAPFHVLWDSRRGDILKFVTGSGSVGVLSSLGLGMVAAVLVPTALNASPGFIADIGAFQNLMVVLACALGTVFLATWLSRRWRGAGPWLALAAVAVAVVQTVVVSVHWTPLARDNFARVDPATAAELATVAGRIPSGAEVIASQGVMGRFGTRRWIFPYLGSVDHGQVVPVRGRTVYAVLVPDQGIESATPAQTAAAAAHLEALGARRLVDRNGVVLLAWEVPPGRRSVTLPATG